MQQFTPDLRPDQVLQDRFVLRRLLRAGASSQLWSAQDLQLDTPLLMQVYFTNTLRERGVLETIKRDARHYRRLRHRHVARILDLHEMQGGLVASIEPHEGELLTTVLASGAPMPYRSMIEKIRPLVEALLHLHESGGEHGRLDPDHVLVDTESQWILLPGDGTRPARSDMRRLGHLMAAALTGANEPEADRQLNDTAERLDKGRTIPALLNQLVSDLRMKAAGLRPASMRDVLHRLDQLENYVEPGPVAAPAPALPEKIIAPAAERARTRPALPLGTWVLVPAILVVGAALWRTTVPRPADPPEAPAAEGMPAVTPPATIDPAAAAADEAPAQRTGAEEALDRYLAVRHDADEIGAAAWARAPYDAALTLAAGAEKSFLDRQYEAATRGYEQATDALQRVIDTGDEALSRLLIDGAGALQAADASKATAAFETALMIAPDSSEARIGLQRAATLDELHRLLGSGRTHENEGRLAFAHADFAAAAELDPHSGEAAAAYDAIKDRLASDQFLTLMSGGLDAYHRGDYTEARARLVEASRFRPDAPQVTQALAMVEEARLREEVERLRGQGLAHERKEQWQAARHAYQQVLAIDASIQFAQTGTARAETMIRLDKHMRHYLADPELLVRRGTREDATRLVQEIEAMPDLPPGLRQTYARFADQVRLANTPRRVVLRSDDMTQVDVYRVGRYGTFRSIELELLPGIYTVVGRRKGYQDVRLTLRLGPGDEEALLEVACVEPIR